MRTFKVSTLIILILLSLVSCSHDYPSYGVLIWSSDESKIPSGSLVGIRSSSDLRKTYEIIAVNGDGHGLDLAAIQQVDQWRVTAIGSLGGANDFMKANQADLRLFVRSQKQALPVRGNPDSSSDMVYRLRNDELAKVVSHASAPSKIGNLEGTWYQILTENGTQGYVFSAQLLMVDLGKGTTTSLNLNDPVLNEIVAKVWRPEAWLDMIQTRSLNLTQFKPEFGLIFDATAKEIRISDANPANSATFPLGNLVRSRKDSWQLEGTSLIITRRDPGSLVVEWSAQGHVISKVFVLVDQDIDKLYAGEIARRTDLLKQLSQSPWKSSYHGDLSFTEDGHFEWSGYDRLVPQAIPQGAGSSGTLNLDTYLGPTVSGAYNGVFTMIFDALGAAQPVYFLYTFKDGGINLELLANSSVRNFKVEHNELNPTILYFTH